MHDPSHLRTFLSVAQTLSFTQAARRLGLRQSTVSQHVRRLEDATGRTLFSRDTHSVELTEDGEAMLGFARRILEVHEQATAFFTGTRLRGRLRFGASEDFVLTRLPEILEGFRHEHPEVDLELTVELSGTLHEQLAAGKLDLVLAKRRPEDPRGELVRHDRLVWIGAERLRLDPARPVPLIVYPPPGITRAWPTPAASSRRAWSGSRTGRACRSWGRSTSSWSTAGAAPPRRTRRTPWRRRSCPAGTGCTAAHARACDNRSDGIRRRHADRRDAPRVASGRARGRTDSVEITAPKLTQPSGFCPPLPHVSALSLADQHRRVRRPPSAPLPHPGPVG